MITNFRSTKAAFLALGVVLALAGAAWACTAQTYINQIGTPRGPSMSRVVLTGNSALLMPAADPSGAPRLEIRWNSANGPRVDLSTEVTGDRFESVVQIPQASPGVHYLVVTLDDQRLASAPFELTPSNSTVASVSPDLWSGFSRPPGVQAQEAAGVQGTPAGQAAAGLGLLGAGAASLALALAVASKAKAGSRG